ncbi:MAG TPA: PD-(D/E)XK nuclease family protein [Candidatus Saccharimonadales bacterium]|nr:PD-(D/E)XK nuclease family protein [Candidatus Saccharimonadales bacterium]
MTYWRERSRPYVPGQLAPYKVSRSKIELFMQCPRCFWLDARLKIKRPEGPPFNINKAIDELFKKEFDTYRQKGEPHPLMIQFGVAAVPFRHELLDTWRENFTGVTALHKPTNLQVFGAVDDLWVNQATGEVIVADYKATAKDKDVSIDAEWQISYKRQLEIYQWLLRQNGLPVSNTGYFVYTNGRLDLDGFHDRIEFRTRLIPYTGDDSWVEPTLHRVKDCLEGDMPAVGTAAMGGECEFCTYARQRTELTLAAMRRKR